jgi:lipoate-protein ligase A
MAIDTWLLEQHRLGLHPPALRFYTWQPAISLGYHQRRYPDFWQQLRWNGNLLDLVRRPSGGRAVLHQGDLTYAVITSGIPGSRIQSYEKICQFLIAGWQALGVELYYGAAKRSDRHDPNCFAIATGADLVTAAGIKLIGSAQLRRQQAILQHGSIRLSTDADLFQQVFGVSLAPLELPLHPPIQQVTEALTTAALTCFDIELEVRQLSDAEWQDIHRQANLQADQRLEIHH